MVLNNSNSYAVKVTRTLFLWNLFNLWQFCYKRQTLCLEQNLNYEQNPTDYASDSGQTILFQTFATYFTILMQYFSLYLHTENYVIPFPNVNVGFLNTAGSNPAYPI